MKHFSTKILVVVLLVVAVLSGYNYFHRPFLKRFPQVSEQVGVTDDQLVDPIQVAFDSLTAREKLAQLVSLPVVLDEVVESDGENGDRLAAADQLAWAAAQQPGFITLFGDDLDASSAAEFSAQLTALELPLRPLVAVDHEGGAVQRLSGEGFTPLPSWRQSCAMAAEARTELFLQSAAELNQAGIQVVFAPVVDVVQAGSFMGTRACLTAEEITATANDYITSFARYAILPVIKHFPGIGSLATDPHFQLDTVELAAQDTVVFDRLLSSFPNIGVMTTHVVVAGRTAGVPCSLSVACLDRFPVNFPEAILFTDALEMASAGLEEDSDQPKELATVATQALLAGNDVLVFGEEVSQEEIEEVLFALESEYQLDENFRRQVDDSVKKVLSVKVPAELAAE